MQTAVAYGFLLAFAGAVEGGGVLIDYLKKSGGNMLGMLRANYGFEVGIDNTRQIEIDYEDERYGTRLYGDVRIGGESLYIGGRQLLRYNSVTGYGAAYFPDSLKVRHNYGDELLSSYRVDSDDEGIIIHKRLRLGNTP